MGNIVRDKQRLWRNGTIPFEWGETYGSDLIVLTSWVGLRGNAKGSGNLNDDSCAVQRGLNRVPAEQGGPMPTLVVDGRCGPLTQNAIQRFQLRQFGWKGADGRVDPDGQTLAKLNELTAGSADPDREGVLAAITEWNTIFSSNLLWSPAKSNDANRVIFDKTCRFNASSAIGRELGSESQNVFINTSKLYTLKQYDQRVTVRGIILHELAHVAGMGHEQQRSDRGGHVRIEWKNVGRCCDFMVTPPGEDKDAPVCDDCFDDAECDGWGHYDLTSTMHYFRNQTSKHPSRPTILAVDAAKQPLKVQPLMGGLLGLNGKDVLTIKNFYPKR